MVWAGSNFVRPEVYERKKEKDRVRSKLRSAGLYQPTSGTYDPSRFAAPRIVVSKTTNRPGGAAFRNAIIERDRRCVVTHCAIPEMLQAAHIRPHRLCEGDQYYDLDNGLLLRADVHLAFDRGLFTFDSNGCVMTREYRIEWRNAVVDLTDRQKEYMAGHRAWYLRKLNNPQVR